MPQSWEETRKAPHKQEQAFIDAWADIRTSQLRSLFPRTAERSVDKDGNASWHSLAECNHKKIKAIRLVENFIPDGEKFENIGRVREWECRDCKTKIAESLLIRLYPSVRFDKPEIDLPEGFHIDS